MNKNATLMSHLQNAAIAVLTVTAVLLLIQTPLVGDLAGKTPYELAIEAVAAAEADSENLGAKEFAARVSSAMGLSMPRATSSDAAIENARAAPASASISTASIRWARARSSSGTEMRTQNGYVPSGLAFPAGEARYSIRVFIVCE